MHAAAGAGVLNALTIGAVDPTSAQPELKALAVRLERGPPPRRAGRGGARPPGPKRLVVVGTGMAGLAVVEEALRRRPAEDWKIVMLGEEPGPVYNRVLLSKLLARDVRARASSSCARCRGTPRHRVDLRGGCRAASLDVDARCVVDESGSRHPYDALVIATGSRAFVPPIPGADLPHVDVFRTWRDADALAATPPGTRAVVVGGGLLGLEAAAGPARARRRASRSSSSPATSWTSSSTRARRRSCAARAGGAGHRLPSLGRSAARIEADRVVLDDGERAARDARRRRRGRARRDVARARGGPATCERGIVVDDALRTSAPGVWAVGECAEHRGVVYGLWAPLAEQARVAGAGVAGDPAAFHGAVQATTLKVSRRRRLRRRRVRRRRRPPATTRSC